MATRKEKLNYTLKIEFFRGEGTKACMVTPETAEWHRITRVCLFSDNPNIEHHFFSAMDFSGIEINISSEAPLKERRKSEHSAKDEAYIVIKGDQRILYIRAEYLDYKKVDTVVERHNHGFFYVSEFWASPFISGLGGTKNPKRHVIFDNHEMVSRVREKIESLIHKLSELQKYTIEYNWASLETYLPIEREIREAIMEFERIKSFYDSYTLDAYLSDIAAGKTPGYSTEEA